MIEHMIFPSGVLDVNSALLWCTKTHEGLLIDPGGEAEEIMNLAEERGVAIRGIALTHAHFDHTGAVPEIKEQTSADIYVHPLDVPLWEGMEGQCRQFDLEPFRLPDPDVMLEDGGTVEFGREKISVVHLPGHSPGSCGFFLEEENLLFAGDLAFAMGVGRTDLWGGSEASLVASLKRLRRFSDEVKVIPGHGPAFRPSEAGGRFGAHER